MSERHNALLVNIVYKFDELGNYPPLSTAFLKAYADKYDSIRDNFNISLFTKSLDDYEQESLLEIINRDKPSVIGFSCYTWNLKRYEEALPMIKRIIGESIIVLGGPEAHPGLLDSIRGADIIAIGEGEAVFKEILDRVRAREPWLDIPGTACRIDGVARRNPPQKLLENLDEIPSPYKTGILPRTPVQHVEYSRGCSNNCSYCVDAKEPYRHMSFERIEEEIEDCVEHGAQIGLTAGAYLNYKDFGNWTLRAIKKRRDIGHDIKIADTLCVDANNIDDEFFNLLDELTPDKSKLSLTIGVQCTHPTTLKLNRRITKLDSIRKLFTKWKFFNLIQLIVGLPGDNIFTVAHTLAESHNLSPYLIQTFSMQVIPNTYLFENKKEFNIVADNDPPHELRSVMDQNEADVRKTRLMADSFSMEFNCGRYL